jgi:plastocyanin
MLFNKLAILALAGTAMAQYGGGPVTPPTPPATPATPAPAAGSGTVHTIMVGAGGLTFTPNNVTAAVGDTVHFEWAPTTGNHSVVQSSKETICTKKVGGTFATTVQKGGYKFDVVVNDTKPMWFFCGVGKHCQGGMFGVINGPTGFTFPTPNDPSATNTGSSASTPSPSSANSMLTVTKSGVFAAALAAAAYLL